MPIGAHKRAKNPNALAKDAKLQSLNMLELLLKARHIANTILMGAHGKRKHGIGENFWQFRPYILGDSIANIDWRRSARDEHIYIKDHEWDIAQTIYIWPDLSQSMHYCSKFTNHSKEYHAILIALTIAELFAKSRERIAIPNLMPPSSKRNVSEHMALCLLHQSEQNLQRPSLPNFAEIGNFSHLFIISDFLDTPDSINDKLAQLAKKNIYAHFIEVCDPAEQQFPYSGRTEFNDPETGEKILAGQAQNYQEAYKKIYFARRESLRGFVQKHSWFYYVSETDKSITDIIFKIASNIRNNFDFKGH